MTIRAYDNQQPEIDESAWVDPSAVVAGKVFLGRDVSVWPHAVIRGDVNSITIGAQTNVQDGAVLHCTHDGPYTGWKIAADWRTSNYRAPSMFTRMRNW